MSLPNFSRALSIISRGEAFSRSFANCSKSSSPFSTSAHHKPKHKKRKRKSTFKSPPIKARKKPQHRKSPEKKEMW